MAVLVVKDFKHTGHSLGLAEVHGLNASLGDRAGNQARIGRMGGRKFRSIARFAGDLQAPVNSWLRLAHVLLGLGGGSAHGQISMAPARRKARISVRLPSSILNALCSRGRASANARSAARPVAVSSRSH